MINFKTKMLKSANTILTEIEKRGYKAYIVGGFVRDLFMGKPSHDIDIATNMPMTELEKIFKTHDIGKSKDFGIVVVNKNGFDFEVANFRQDLGYSDGRHPDKVKIVNNFRDDASRRDLTFNALGIDKNGKIVDYFGGVNDIKNKIVRTVGNPKKRFSEDYLRMLRTLRFAARFGFDIDKDTFQTIQDLKENIKKIAPERIKDEIFKLAGYGGKQLANGIRLMEKSGLLELILPELHELTKYYESPKHHPEAYKYGSGRVIDHVLTAVEKSKSKDPLVNISILLHDIGKNSKTYKLRTKNDGKEYHTYYNHDNVGLNEIDKIADRLKFSNNERDAIKFAAKNHMKLESVKKPIKVLKLVNNPNWDILKQVVYADWAAREDLFDKKKYDKMIAEKEDIAKQWENKIGKGGKIKVIDGKDVIRLTGMKPSKKLGDFIKHLTSKIVNENKMDMTKKDVEEFILSEYKKFSKK